MGEPGVSLPKAEERAAAECLNTLCGEAYNCECATGLSGTGRVFIAVEG